MGEFWVGAGESGSVKLAAAIGHTHGRAVVGAEAFTAQPENGRWLNYPGSLKAPGDLQWCDGVNRFIFHRYAHQPWLDKFPGMTMAQYGIHFERTVTWWEQARAWMSYCARSQFRLHPRCEYRTDPLGVDVAQPRLGCEILAHKRGRCLLRKFLRRRASPPPSPGTVRFTPLPARGLVGIP